MFAECTYLTWARQFHGKYPFDLSTSGMARVALAEWNDTPAIERSTGYDELAAAMARHLATSPDTCVATLGTSHALWIAYAATLAPGDEVLVEFPGYEPLIRAAEAAFAHVTRFTRRAEDNYAIDLESVRRAWTPKTRMCVVTNLHNPTGVRTPKATLTALADFARARGGYLLVDEAYAPFDAFCDDAGIWPDSARALSPSVLAVGSLTKTYGLGPHRIGWLTGPRAVIERARDVIFTSCGHLPLSHASIAARAFTQLPTWAARSRAFLSDKRQRVERWMHAHPDLTWSAPTEGLFGFALHKNEGDLRARIEAGGAAHGVLVGPGSFFGVPNGFRLGWAIADDLLDEALVRLDRVLSP